MKFWYLQLKKKMCSEKKKIKSQKGKSKQKCK